MAHNVTGFPKDKINKWFATEPENEPANAVPGRNSAVAVPERGGQSHQNDHLPKIEHQPVMQAAKKIIGQAINDLKAGEKVQEGVFRMPERYIMFAVAHSKLLGSDQSKTHTSFDSLDRGYFTSICHALSELEEVVSAPENDNNKHKQPQSVPDKVRAVLKKGKIRSTMLPDIMHALLNVVREFCAANPDKEGYDTIRDKFHSELLQHIMKHKDVHVRLYVLTFLFDHRLSYRERQNTKPKLSGSESKGKSGFPKPGKIAAQAVFVMALMNRDHDDEKIRSCARLWLGVNEILWREYLVVKYKLKDDDDLNELDVILTDTKTIQSRRESNLNLKKRKLPETLAEIYKFVPDSSNRQSEAKRVEDQVNKDMSWKYGLTVADMALIQEDIGKLTVLINSYPLSGFYYCTYQLIFAQADNFDTLFSTLDMSTEADHIYSPCVLYTTGYSSRLLTAEAENRILPEWLLEDMKEHQADANHKLDQEELSRLIKDTNSIVDEANTQVALHDRLAYLVKKDRVIREICQSYKTLLAAKPKNPRSRKYTNPSSGRRKELLKTESTLGNETEVDQTKSTVTDDPSDEPGVKQPSSVARLTVAMMADAMAKHPPLLGRGPSEWATFWRAGYDLVSQIRDQGKQAISKHISETHNSGLKSIDPQSWTTADGRVFLNGTRLFAEWIALLIAKLQESQLPHMSEYNFKTVTVSSWFTESAVRELFRVSLVKKGDNGELSDMQKPFQKYKDHLEKHFKPEKIHLTIEEYVKCGYNLALQALDGALVSLTASAANTNRKQQEKLDLEDRFVIKVLVGIWFAYFTFPRGELLTWGPNNSRMPRHPVTIQHIDELYNFKSADSKTK